MGRSAQKTSEFDLLRVRLPPGYLQCLKECAALETEETGEVTTMSDIVRGQIGDYLRARGITPRRARTALRSTLPPFIPSGHDVKPVNSLYEVAHFDIELGVMYGSAVSLDEDGEE